MTFDKLVYAEVILTRIQGAKECIENQNPYRAYSRLDQAEDDMKDLINALQREDVQKNDVITEKEGE